MIIFLLDKGPFIYDVSYFGGRGSTNSDILLTHADGGGGVYKFILWVREKSSKWFKSLNNP